jgi:hypothetical protein
MVDPGTLSWLRCTRFVEHRAYPLVDHVADKVAAMFELHGEKCAPSTRYRDLVDLVAIVISASVDAAPAGDGADF